MPVHSDLPFAAGRADLLAALRERGMAIVQAPPGTGKTTLAPQYVLDYVQERGCHQSQAKVIVTQPRRVAARSSAARIAELRGTTLGEEIGYTVRGEQKVSSRTRIEMVTPGVLLRRLLANPDLDGAAAVIIDEVHERHLESDLVFGMLAQLRELRSSLGEELAVVAMSATMDAEYFATLLGGDGGAAPLVSVPSPIHPLDIRYCSAAASMVNRDRRSRTSIEDLVLSTVRQAWADTASGTVSGNDGDILAFVPSIRGTEEVASSLVKDGIPALALHGRLSPQDQARIVGGSTHQDHTRRIIVATDVAESSLTVPGVRVVVDSCLARISRRDAGRGMSILVTETASQSSMTQRAGRAGREGPGTVYRCITAEQYAKAPANSPPAILTNDLTAATLDVACWGSPRGADLPLPDPFPQAATLAAEEALHAIDALHPSGAVTAFGRRLARIPTDPRLARGGLQAAERVDALTVAKVLAVLDGGSTGDLPHDLPRSSDPMVRRFHRIINDATKESPQAGHRKTHLTGTDAVAYTLACAFPGLIARRVESSGNAGNATHGLRYLTVSGTGAVWRDASRHSSPEWIAVADLTGAASRASEGTGAVIRTAVPLQEDTAFFAAAPLRHEDLLCTWNPGGATGKLIARKVRTLGAIELASTPMSAMKIDPELREEAVRTGLKEHGLGALEWSANAEELRRRMHYLHTQGVPGYPDVATAQNSEELLNFVVPELAAGKRPDIAGLLRGLIPWNRRIDVDAPTSLELPAGRTVRLQYPETGTDGPVVLATKLQDCFGLQESPQIAGRRIQCQLLSPAQRPLAVTDDLDSFWAGPYKNIRAEMRGRYPKHPWPERP